MSQNTLDADSPDILEIDEFIAASNQDLESTSGAFLWANIHIRNEFAFNLHFMISNLRHEFIVSIEEIKDADIRKG